MPTVTGIRKTLKQRLPAEQLTQIDFPQSNGNPPEEVLELIRQMDELLPREVCLAVMQEQGCHKDDVTTAPFRAFAAKHAGKSVKERLDHFDELVTGHKAPCHLNPDGTLSIYWDGWDPVQKRCVCYVVKRLYKQRGGPFDISPTFCGCCAGHVRNTYQLALGANLTLKEIVSSPISTGGKERCEFLFVVEE